MKIIFGIGGTLEAALVPYHIVYLLAHFNIEIQTVLTPKAKKFVSIEALQCITKNKVYYNNFQFNDENIPLHLALSESDLLIIYPCTARLIAQFALGDITCPVTRIFSFFKKENILIAPFLHPKMDIRIYQPHFDTLKNLGCKFLSSSTLTGFKEVSDYFNQNFAELSISPISNFLNKT